jgi:hypothetical protein
VLETSRTDIGCQVSPRLSFTHVIPIVEEEENWGEDNTVRTMYSN